MHTVALVGFMGAGKTTVGQELASRLNWRFADLDQLIETHDRRSIPEIFRQDGEQHFRELEHTVLENSLSAPESKFLILALGGGAFVLEKVRAALLNHQVPAVWLDAPVEELFRRCEQPEVIRPLRKDPEQFTKLYEQRLSSYRHADLHVVTKGKEISAIAEEITERLGLEPRSAE